MKTIPVNPEIIQTEVLVIGGGMGGMQAAISAADAGAKVIVAEKSDTRRSGNGSTGNDHFACYMPSVHGNDIGRVIAETQNTQIGKDCDVAMLRTMLLHSEVVIHKWEEYGIPMKPFGEYIFEGHTLPGRQRYHLKYDGKNQKPILTRVAREKGVVIKNHVTITEILTAEDGRVAGAMGIDTSQESPQIVVFQCKAAILTAGGADARLFTNGTPAYIFNVTHCPANACAAAIAYRAGARLDHCDLLGRHATPKYFERAGKATWLGMLSDIDGKHLADFAEKPTREFGDPLMNIWASVFGDRMRDGSGPTYMNCTEMSDEDLKYMEYCFGTEGLSSLTDYFNQHGIDLKKDMIEYTSTGYRLARGGVEINVKAEASIKGLYASGNIVGNASGGITCAVGFGDIAGENAAKYVKEVEYDDVIENPIIAQRKEMYEGFLNRENGADWKEANTMLAQIMQDYLGAPIKSEPTLQAGLEYLQELKRRAYSEVAVSNAHELMRMVEVIDLIDMGELSFLCVMNRKESRAALKRKDYPYTNTMLNGMIETIEKKDGSIQIGFRRMWK